MAQPFAKRFNANKETLEWYDCLALSIVIIALLFTFVVRVVRVDGSSMVPTLENNERILITGLGALDYGDIIVIDSYSNYGRPLVKRIVGRAGDEINIDFNLGVVYRNGVALDEPYTAEPTTLVESVVFPITVPEGTLFVMGDNRNHSTDSRDTRVGCVSVNNVLGKALWRITPFQKIGKIE